MDFESELGNVNGCAGDNREVEVCEKPSCDQSSSPGLFLFGKNQDISSPVAGVTGYIGGLINQAVGNVFSNNQPTGFTLNQNLGGNTASFCSLNPTNWQCRKNNKQPTGSFNFPSTTQATSSRPVVASPTLPNELKAVRWQEYISGPQGQLDLPLGRSASGFDPNRKYYLGFGAVTIFFDLLK